MLKEGKDKELPRDHPDWSPATIMTHVDWSKTKAYGIGFNGLYVNREGREAEGCVPAGEVDALVKEIAEKLEAVLDEDGAQVIVDATITADAYVGARVDEAPEIQVGYNRGYGNSDESSLGRITNQVLMDNMGGTFTGSHLMDPSVVLGTILTNREIAAELPRLEDLTVEILRTYGIQPDPEMTGVPVFRD